MTTYNKSDYLLKRNGLQRSGPHSREEPEREPHGDEKQYPRGRVARRGFEPLTSSLKGKRPGPLGDRAAPQGYGRRTDDAALSGVLRLVHRLIGLLDELIRADVGVGALRDPDRGAHVHRLAREIEG